MKPLFFASQAEFLRWLKENHKKESELWVGFHKKATGKPSLTWPESVDAALCYGWIDGLRKSVDAGAYKIRFTPRKAGSTWSAVNIRRAKELIDGGWMRPAGMEAFRKRTDERSAIYSYEQRKNAELDAESEKRFRADKAAWAFFESQPPSYRRTAKYYVMSAKLPETRQRRLSLLIEDSRNGQRIGPLRKSTG